MFVAGGDGRGAWTRRLKDIVELHLSDLGGPDNISEAERSIVRRVATLTVELERIEARFAVSKGSDGDLDLYQRTASAVRRLLETIGLQRRSRDVQTLEQYVAERYPADRAEDGASESPQAETAIALQPVEETPLPDPPTAAGVPFSNGVSS
jgi:hypothetical protein